MTTEYYQIPSQQGFLPLPPSTSGDSADPWLASATNSLSLSSKVSSPPSLFEPGDVEASVAWNHVVPLQLKVGDVKVSPVAPKQFHSLSTSKIDAWSVVADNNTVKIASPKISKQVKAQKQQPASPVPQPIKQVKQQPAAPQPQPQQQVQQVQQAAVKLTVEEKPIEEELTHQNRYKTELCKSFTETGNCRYGSKCQFAHGKEEIRPILRHPKYKTEICKTFHTTGTCPYGIRCRFIHTRSKEESILAALQPQEEEEDVDDDETANAPPGLPVPQWSKSWSMSMAPVQTKPARRVAAVAAPEPAF